jgi:hypothetical protein
MLVEEKPGEMSVYQQLVHHVAEKQVSKRFGYSLTSFLRKVNTLHSLVDLHGNWEALSQDCVLDKLDFITETVENVDQCFGYPLILPAQTVVELPQPNPQSENCFSWSPLPYCSSAVLRI